MTPKNTKLRKIAIYGGRLFMKSSGYSYCMAHIYINDEFIHTTEYQHGFERYYETTAIQWLIANKYITMPEYEDLSKYCKDNNIEFFNKVTDFKKDIDFRRFIESSDLGNKQSIKKVKYDQEQV